MAEPSVMSLLVTLSRSHPRIAARRRCATLSTNHSLRDKMGAGKGWSGGEWLVPRSTCAMCGKLFYAPPIQKKRGGGFYCSRRCYGDSKKKSIHTKACASCGNQFIIEEATYSSAPTKCIKCVVKACVDKTLKKVGDVSRTITSSLKRIRTRGYVVNPMIFMERKGNTRITNKVITKNKSNLCETCRTEYIGHGNSRFCSKACIPKKYPAHNANCLKCGNPFYSVPSHRLKGWGMYCSITCRPARSSYTAGKGGTREDIGIYVRSTWEANYARYLNFLVENGSILKWEYEPITFYFTSIKRGVRSYTPDFRITEINGEQVFHEVKGYMDDKSKVKLARMAKFYPEHKVIIISNKEMREIKNKLAKLINNWEYGDNDKLGYNRRKK